MYLKPEVFAPVHTLFPVALPPADANNNFNAQFSPWLTIMLSVCLYPNMLPAASLCIVVTCPDINPVVVVLVVVL